MTEQTCPLQWPAGRPRTPAHLRKSGKYHSEGEWITRSKAIRRLADEVQRIGGLYLSVSTDLALRRDGQPYAGKGEPEDPGVVAFFTLKGQPVALPCDTFDRLAQNIAGLAAHIEATRQIELIGVASATESLQAFLALPSPEGSTEAATKPWREVLGLKPDFPNGYDREDAEIIVQGRWRARASAAHPDTGGSVEKMAVLNLAREEALAVVKS